MWALGGWSWPPPARPKKSVGRPLFEIGLAIGAENPGPGTYEVATSAPWASNSKPQPTRAKHYAPDASQSHNRVGSAKLPKKEIGPGEYDCRSDWGSGRGAVRWCPVTPRKEPPPPPNIVPALVRGECDAAQDAAVALKHPGAPLPGWARRLFDYHRSLKDGCPGDVETDAPRAARSGKRATPSGHQWSNPRGGYEDPARFPGKARRDPRRWTVEAVVRHRGTVRPTPTANELQTIGASLGLKMLPRQRPSAKYGEHVRPTANRSLAEPDEVLLLPDDCPTARPRDGPSHRPAIPEAREVVQSTRVTVAAYVPEVLKPQELVSTPAGGTPPAQHRHGTPARPVVHPAPQLRPRAEHRAHTTVGLCVGEARSPSAAPPAQRGVAGVSEGRISGTSHRATRGKILEQKFHSVSAADEDLEVLVGKIEVKHRVLRKDSSMQSHAGRPGSEQSVPIEKLRETASPPREADEPERIAPARSSPLRVPRVLPQAPTVPNTRTAPDNSWPMAPSGGLSTPVSEARWRRASASPDPTVDGNGSDFSGSPSEELL
mmetsp:Transcript_13541/g.29317  ORF Transcript_13541/g.29317 Transcript_13541/m.29317 type:complete len:546 (-) Transcript_13541:39-1676(-)